MKLYVLTDELAEEVINVFMAKNDAAAVKITKANLQSHARQNEVKLHALDISIDYDEKLVAFYDDDNGIFEDKDTRIIYSFPDDLNLSEEEVKKEIMKESD